MGSQSFTVCQGSDNWTKSAKTIRGNFLRSDVLLEGLGINATELACITVCRKGVVRARCIVATAEKDVSR